jgi:uncharacterized protein with beta-barrel porin domain
MALLGAIACLGFAPRASAQTTIPLTPLGNNLYNTGVENDGTTFLGNNQLDTHYTYTTTPAFGTGQTYQVHLDPTVPVPGPLPNNWVANTPATGSQWITVTQSTANAHGPTQTFFYHLTLTNIPIGAQVHLTGMVADDDSAQILANGSTPIFSNSAVGVVQSNFATFQTIPAVVFTAGSSNSITIAVTNGGGFSTGLNLDLTGSYYTALTSTAGLGIQFTPPPNLTPNQTKIVNVINQINAIGVDNACFANLTTALLGATTTQFGSDLDQLSPEKLGIFSSIAFNDASFRTSNLDDYTAHRRNSAGELQVTPGNIDFSGLAVHDANVDPALASVSNHLLAWSPTPTPGLLSDSTTALTSLVSPAATGKDMTDNFNFFVSGDVILGQDFSQPELDHTDYTTSSFQIGSDYQFGQHFLAGVLFDYSHTDTALDAQGSSATIDSYSPGVFASFAQDGWFANALGTYSRNNYTESRHIAFGSFNETANGAPNGDQETANLDGGYEFHSKDKAWTYGPTAGLQYTHLGVGAFTEGGGCSSDLSVQNEAADSLRSRFGGRISYAMFDNSNRAIFTPYIDASWQHEWLAGSRNITSSFHEVSGDSFTVTTPSTSRDSALLVAGFDADITKNLTLFSNYAVQVGESDYFGQSIQAGLKIGF